MSPRRNNLVLVCPLVVPILGTLLGTFTGTLGAQVRGTPPALLHGKAQDPGVAVEMFESANLDRFLRRAQDLLGREDYGRAILVLQEVIEGRTGEFTDPEEERKAAEARKAAARAAKRAAEKNGGRTPRKPAAKPAAKPGHDLPLDDDNPAYSVFSSDERIYRPVARLCHELLASMPAEGIGLYRLKFEAQAEKAYDVALAAGDVSGLEAVYTHYFATLSAARALRDAASLLMDSGRFRAAIQTLNTLLDVYPEISRREAGLRDVLLMVKTAICFQQLGELELAREQLVLTTHAFPEDSVRLMGELYAVKDLHASALFSVASIVVEEAKRSTFTVDLSHASGLVPLWEFRFTMPTPYKSKTNVRTNRGFNSRAMMLNGKVLHGNRFPRLKDYGPGTSVRFVGDSLVFLDSYRPVEHELTSGRQLLAMGPSSLAEFSVPTNNQIPRARNPAYDYFANRVAVDDKNYYSLIGYHRTVSGNATFKGILDNSLVAFDRKTGKERWHSDSKVSSTRKRAITFLATPTVYRNTLLVPFLDAGSYGLLCLSTRDKGTELYRTYLHYRGTAFARAPSAPVVVDAGIAYVLTNAGVLSSVDANTGVINWSRKYERVHPRRGRMLKKARRRNVNMFGGGYVAPLPSRFRGFAPTDLYVADDLLIVGAVDSTALLCLNGANGDVRWLQNADTPQYHDVLNNQLRYIVGHNKDFLFVMCGESQLVCIGLKSGLRYWLASVPGVESGDWSGRGCVTEDYVVLPGKAGTRRVHVIAANTEKKPQFHSMELPTFSLGKEPFSGPANIFVHGAYLALSYEGGIELYSTSDALAALAEQSEARSTRAAYLVHAGKLGEAAEILLAELGRSDLDGSKRRKLSIRVLSLAEDISAKLAGEKRGEAALAILDRCEKRMQDPRYIRRVHLFRLKVFRTLGDLAGIEREQEFIESGSIK